MNPNDGTIVSYRRQLAEALTKPGNVLASPQRIDGKLRQERDEADRQKQAIDEIHRLEFKLKLAVSEEYNLKVGL